MSKIYHIANFFIKKGVAEKIPLGNLKLQKLVYFSFGFYVRKYNIYLFKDDIEAWPLGPVIPDLYHKFKKENSNNKMITNLLSVSDNVQFTNEECEVLKEVWDCYKHTDAWVMVEETPTEIGPWANSSCGTPMDKERIKLYFILNLGLLDKFGGMLQKMANEEDPC